jgi:hypothetical protein
MLEDYPGIYRGILEGLGNFPQALFHSHGVNTGYQWNLNPSTQSGDAFTKTVTSHGKGSLGGGPWVWFPAQLGGRNFYSFISSFESELGWGSVLSFQGNF